MKNIIKYIFFTISIFLTFFIFNLIFINYSNNNKEITLEQITKYETNDLTLNYQTIIYAKESKISNNERRIDIIYSSIYTNIKEKQQIKEITPNHILYYKKTKYGILYYKLICF